MGSNARNPRIVHFGDCVFKNRSRDLIARFQSLAQEAAHTNAGVELRGGAALRAFCRAVAHTRDRVREPVRSFHLDLLSSGGERCTQVADLVLNVCGIFEQRGKDLKGLTLKRGLGPVATQFRRV